MRGAGGGGGEGERREGEGGCAPPSLSSCSSEGEVLALPSGGRVLVAVRDEARALPREHPPREARRLDVLQLQVAEARLLLWHDEPERHAAPARDDLFDVGDPRVLLCVDGGLPVHVVNAPEHVRVAQGLLRGVVGRGRDLEAARPEVPGAARHPHLALLAVPPLDLQPRERHADGPERPGRRGPRQRPPPPEPPPLPPPRPPRPAAPPPRPAAPPP